MSVTSFWPGCLPIEEFKNPATRDGGIDLVVVQQDGIPPPVGVFHMG